MAAYETIFRVRGQVASDISYDFDGPYFEHLAFLWGQYPCDFAFEKESTVEVRDIIDGRVVLTGAYEPGSEAAHPGWRFWTLDALNPAFREIAFFSCD